MLLVVEKEYQGKKYFAVVYRHKVNDIVIDTPIRFNSNLEKELVIKDILDKQKGNK